MNFVNSIFQIMARQSLLAFLMLIFLASSNQGPRDKRDLSNFGNSLLRRFEKVQNVLGVKDEECIPGSLYYNGTCIYMSKSKQKLSWTHAYDFCRKLPFNASLLVVKNDHHYSYLQTMITKVKQEEDPRDQLVYYVGYRSINGSWQWSDSQESLVKSKRNLTTLDEHWQDWNNSLGDCGSLVLLRNGKLIMRSAPCESTSSRFICQYVLNACYKNTACGSHGRCVNLYYTFKCDCSSVSIFYEGEFCSKLNAKAIQTILALMTIGLILALIALFKIYRSRVKILRNAIGMRKALTKFFKKVWSKARRVFWSLKAKMTVYSYLERLFYSMLHVLPVLLLVLIQLAYFNRDKHSNTSVDQMALNHYFENWRNSNGLVSFVCNKFDRYYMFQEIVYLIVAFVFMTCFCLFKSKKIYSSYIVENFKFHLQYLKPKRESSGEGFSLKKLLNPASFSASTLPFGITHRWQSISIFVIYTFDILNLILRIFSFDFYKQAAIEYSKKSSGVFIDLLIQFVQVLLVGFKYYPLLLISDENPSITLYLICFVYMLIIFAIRFVDRALCYRASTSMQLRRFLGLDGSLELKKDWADKRNEFELIKRAQDLFSEYFNKPKGLGYTQTIEIDSNGDLTTLANFSSLENEFSVTQAPFKAQQSANSTHEQNFNYFNLIHWFDLIENLPVYLAIAFLIVNYGMRCFSMIIEKSFDYSDRLKNLGVKQEDYLLARIRKADQNDDHRLKLIDSNVNYKYIHRVIASKERSFCLSRIYKYIPHMKFSKHYLNTYTVAFMILYIFTLFSIRLSTSLGQKLDRIVNFLYEFLFESKISAAKLSVSSAVYSRAIVYHVEFSLACIITSAIIFTQLLTSVLSFRKDLYSLNRGVNIFNRIKFSKMFKRKKAKLVSVIISNSIHFQGYLVSHLVYGYLVCFLVSYGLISVIKIIYRLPNVFQKLIQLLIPLLIVIFLRYFLVRLINEQILLRKKSKHIRNPAVYYLISYFSFFYDCVVGLVACINRLWQTLLVSLFLLPRIDRSIFNRDSHFIIKRLDRGHLAYVNYVYIEHIYNNPILVGFTDMLVEATLRHRLAKSKGRVKSFLILRNLLFIAMYHGSLRKRKVPAHRPPAHGITQQSIITYSSSKINSLA